MRILVITGTFHPEPGGPPTYLAGMLPALQARGHEVRVITYGEGPAGGYGYPVRRVSRAQSVPARLWAFARMVLGGARGADVLFVQGYPFPALPAHILFRRPMVVKVVSDFTWEYALRHGLTRSDVIAFQRERHPWRLRLLRAVHHRALRRARGVIVPSEHVARLARGWGIPPERVHVIHNAIPASDLAGADRAQLRAELDLPGGFLLVSVGRLTAVKGVDLAINALARLSDAHLAVIGEGEQRAALEAQAAALGVAGRVHWTGYQPHERVLAFVRAADVFVLSSHTEGLSHVLLEALSVGTPVVATTVGGNTEILTGEQNGLLVPPGDAAALAEAIARLQHDTTLRDRLAAAGQRRSTDFSWDTTVDRTEALLRAAARR